MLGDASNLWGLRARDLEGGLKRSVLSQEGKGTGREGASAVSTPAHRQPMLGHGDPDQPGDHHVAGAQAGDEAAFVVLYRHVHPGLLRYLSMLVGEDGEDVAAETWVHVCRDLHRFEGGLDSFRGWVATIGRHRAMDHLRATRRRPSVPFAPEDMPAPAPGPDSADAALESISTAQALQLIATLPPDQAEAVMLRSVMGLDAPTAGAVLGKRPGAVRTAAHRGLRTLARRLPPEVAPTRGQHGGVTGDGPSALSEVP